MGRIEEALRRTSQEPGPAHATGASDADPRDGAPWTFGESSDEERPVLGPVQAHRIEPTRPGESAMLASERGRLRLFRGFSGLMVDRLVASRSAPPALVEQFRHLAATLHHAQVAQGLKTLMVTSALARDGKTLTATNTALTLSESYGRKVLLIDADLRRPSLHEAFQLPNVSGLNDGLKAKYEEKLALLEISDTLTLLPAGRPDPDPLSGLSSARMKRIIQEAAARFDWVIVDTPPVGLLADANIVAGMIDAALLVIRAGVTPFADVENAVSALGRDRILGVILNGVDPSGVQSQEYYYRYYGHHPSGPETR